MPGSDLTRLEIASGVVLDRSRSAAPLPRSGRAIDHLTALERAVLPALERPPCLVSFSGGRDSSAVLATATRLARREGLPLPIPATIRFPNAQASDETLWQEQVIAWLGLGDWLRPEFTDELDTVGPVATSVLRRHGLLWPCNAHFHVPLFERSAGGSLLTGAGGDEIFGPSRWARASAVLGGRARPTPRDVVRVGFALAPTFLRARVIAGRFPSGWPWLRDGARSSLIRALAADAASEPVRWAPRLRRIRGSRYLEVGLSSLSVLAADFGVAVTHPLLDDDFVGAIARLPRGRRYSDRTSAMRMLFSDVLPDGVLTRTGKAQFNAAFWTEHSRAFVERWQGDGADDELVDAESLRQAWSADEPDAGSFTLLQSVWLAQERRRPGSSAPEPLDQMAAGSVQ